MSKRTKKTQKNNNQRWMILAAVVIAIVVVAGVIIASGSGDDEPVNTGLLDQTYTDPQDITPKTYNEVILANNEDHFLLDVRTPAEFSEGHINGATNINVEELASRLSEVPQDTPIVLYCRTGNRSAVAAQLLDDAGYTNIFDMDGIVQWQDAGYELVK